MSRTVILTPGETYHIYNRGTEKRQIYMDAADYERFQILLYLCNSKKAVRLDDFTQGRTLRELWEFSEPGEQIVDVLNYCMMPNHFHLMVHERVENGVSKFMQKLLTAYTMYFNTRYERTGALFQGRYKALHVADDGYLKYLVSYIHLNPVKLFESTWKESGVRDRRGAERFLQAYTYSSFLDYCGQVRLENHILNTEALKKLYDAPLPNNFRQFVREWLDHPRDTT